MEDIISLVGPRAAGKTTFGKKLAKRLGYEFIDLDTVMMEQLKSYGGIFGYSEKYGWSAYMDRLHYTLKKLFKELEGKKVILDLGGGTISSEFPQSEQNAHLVRRHSKICLVLPHEEDDKNVEVLVEREKERLRTNESPWAIGWSEKKVVKKVIKEYFDRLPNFKKYAHHNVYTADQSPRKVAKLLIKQLNID